MIVFKIIVLFYLSSTAFAGESYNEARSIKSVFLKRDFQPPKSKVIAEFQSRISNVEGSLDNLKGQMTTVKNSNHQMAKTLQQQHRLLEKLDSDFVSISQMLSTHGNTLSDLEATIHPDEKVYTFSNQTCGGVMEAQAGSAVYTSEGGYKGQIRYDRRVLSGSTYYPAWLAASCVWTVQANHRSTIQLVSNMLEIPGTSEEASLKGAYVLEGMVGSSTTIPSPKVTKLEKRIHYTFEGPLIFVVLVFPSYSPVTSSLPASTAFGFQFEYESRGLRTQTDILFSHKNLDAYNNSQHFNTDTHMEQSIFENSISTNTNITSFSSITLTNFTTKLNLRTKWLTEGCADNQTFLSVVPVANLLTNGTGARNFINLCQLSNSSEHLIVSLGKPVIILVKKTVHHQFPIDLSWITEPEYPSAYYVSEYTSTTKYKACGQVLGGLSGMISYKFSTSYRNGERCVWVVKPQPGVGSGGIEFTFDFGSLGSWKYYGTLDKVTQHDHVYVMELTTLDGLERPGGPKITKFNATRLATTFTAMSREVYVVFYSDFAEVMYGFLLKWRVVGNILEGALSESSRKFEISSSSTGTLNLEADSGPFNVEANNVFVFIPQISSASYSTVTPTYLLGMDLQLNWTSGSHVDCIQQAFQAYAPSNTGVLEERKMQCTGPGAAVISNADGMVILIPKPSAQGTYNGTVDFAWKNDHSGLVRNENNKCGGVLIGKKGIVRYKLESNINKNEDCIWLFNSANATSITIKVLQHDMAQTDVLVGNTIDTRMGLLRDDAQQLTSPSNRHFTTTFNDSLLVVSLRARGAVSGKGFILLFWSNHNLTTDREYDEGTTDASAEIVDVRLRHSETRLGRYLLDSANNLTYEPEVASQQVARLRVLAYSVATVSHVSSKPVPTSLNWTMGVFKKQREGCLYDSIVFYTTNNMTQVDKMSEGNGQYWTKNVEYPGVDQKADCPDQVRVNSQSNILRAENGAFLMIYRTVANPVEDDRGTEDRTIDFIHSEIRNLTVTVPTSFDDSEAIELHRCIMLTGYRKIRCMEALFLRERYFRPLRSRYGTWS